MTLKRTFDLAASIGGLAVLALPLGMLSLLVKLEDGGSVFFRQERIGRYGRPFRIWKFRTMVEHAEKRGLSITVGEDPRITRTGRWMRKYKVDELPQLLNVLVGDMTFVGPRPEVPRYIALYDEAQRKVIELRPGITDPASIKYRNESDLLAGREDPDAYYIREIMPDKIRINLDYEARRSIWSDLGLIFETLGLVKR